MEHNSIVLRPVLNKMLFAYIPLQVNPSPVNPWLQSHLYDPLVFIHLAFTSQTAVSIEHSSSSKMHENI